MRTIRRRDPSHPHRARPLPPSPRSASPRRPRYRATRGRTCAHPRPAVLRARRRPSSVDRRRPSGRAASRRGGGQHDQLAGQLDGGCARERDGEDRPHAGTHRLWAIWIRTTRPEATDGAPSAWAERIIVPTLPGLTNAMQVDAEDPAGRPRPALPIDPDRPRARPQHRNGLQQPGLHLQAVLVRGCAAQSHPPPAGQSPEPRAAATRSSPSATNWPARSRAARRPGISLRICFRWLVCQEEVIMSGCRDKKDAL